MNYEIIGANGKFDDIEGVVSKLKELGDKYDAAIQLLDAKLIYGRRHLESSILHTERAFESGTNLAGDPAIEILLYSSGERQIKLAIEKMGISPKSTEFAVVIYKKPNAGSGSVSDELLDAVLKDLSLVRNDTVLEGDQDVLERFGIEKNEIDSTPAKKRGNLILSRVAMVDVIK